MAAMSWNVDGRKERKTPSPYKIVEGSYELKK